ncbi:MAG: hypothetical protein AAF685_04610 [Cyanobacteria bacterium P01_C01_bin.89]|mgnify:CR=1 FL=1
MQTLALQIPDSLYDRLYQTARAVQQPIEQIVLRSLQIGAPPGFDDVPAEFQTRLAELDGLEDGELFAIAATKQSPQEFARYETLLSLGDRSDAEQTELDSLRFEADLLMLRKAHAAALLRWRGPLTA